MRIISKFNDYYDTVQSYGVDKTLVYLRKTREESINLKQHKKILDIQKDFLSLLPYDYDERTVFSNIIGFCGKLFPYYKIINLRTLKTHYCYTEKDIDKYYKSLGKKEHPMYIQSKNKYKNGYYKTQINPNLINDFFNKYSAIDYMPIFRELKTPIFLIQEKKDYNLFKSHLKEKKRNSNEYIILSNPNLKELNFQKVYDPHTAYQEIASFISGVLGVGESPMIEISNIDKRDKKGFDEWSFKKRKHNRKSQRSSNKI